MSLRIESTDHRCRDSSFSSSQSLSLLHDPSTTVLGVSPFILFLSLASSRPLFPHFTFVNLAHCFVSASSTPFSADGSTPSTTFSLVSRSFLGLTDGCMAVHTSAYSTNCSAKNAVAIVRKYYYGESVRENDFTRL